MTSEIVTPPPEVLPTQKSRLNHIVKALCLCNMLLFRRLAKPSNRGWFDKTSWERTNLPLPAPALFEDADFPFPILGFDTFVGSPRSGI